MSVKVLNAKCILKSDNIIGECPVWDHRSGLLCWIDINKSCFYTFNPSNDLTNTYQLPENAGSFGLCNNINHYIFSFKNGPCIYNPFTNTILHRIFTITSNKITLNDGRCDRNGNFIVGGAVVREKPYIKPKGSTSIFRINSTDLSHINIVDGISCSNSICFSLDGKIMYWTDSRDDPIRSIKCGDYNPINGSISNIRTFVKWNKNDQIGVPDGSCIDSDGYLWNAIFQGSKVIRYDSHGNVNIVVNIPEECPTCCCIGGNNLDILYITTAKYKSKNGKGSLYAVKLHDIKGVNENIFNVNYNPIISSKL